MKAFDDSLPRKLVLELLSQIPP